MPLLRQNNFLHEVTIDFSSCNIKDNQCVIESNNNICCLLYIVVAVVRYLKIHNVKVFLLPDNGVDKQNIAKLLSDQFIGSQLFSFDETLTNEKLLSASNTNLFFVWWRQNETTNTEPIKLFNRMIAFDLLRPPRVLCIFTDGVEDPRNLLKGVNLSPLTFVAVIQKNSNQNATGYLLYDVYGADENHTLVTRLIGRLWVHGNVVRFNNTEVFPEKIRKLLNYTIRIGALRRPPFTDYDPETDELSGVLGDILMTTKKLLCLRYDTHLSGEDNATRTLDIFEELLLNKSDLILGVHTLNRRRIILYSFSRAITLGQYLITYHRPKLTRFASGYVAAFTNELWTIVLTSFLIFNIILTVTNKIFRISSRNNTNTENVVENIKTTIFNTIAAIAQRGDAYLRQSQSSQILWFTFCVFSLLIFTSFSSKLTSFFTVYTEKTPFKSFNDLLDNSNFSVTAIINSSAYKRIEKAKSGVNAKLKHRVAKYVESSKAGVEYVYTHRDTVFLDHNVQVYSHLRDNCSFATIAGSTHYKHGFHFVFTKNHPLIHGFNKVLYMLQETGIISKVTEPVKWVSEVYCAEQTKYAPVTIKQISPLIYILALGIAMSVFVFIVERCVCVLVVVVGILVCV